MKLLEWPIFLSFILKRTPRTDNGVCWLQYRITLRDGFTFLLNSEMVYFYNVDDFLNLIVMSSLRGTHFFHFFLGTSTLFEGNVYSKVLSAALLKCFMLISICFDFVSSNSSY